MTFENFILPLLSLGGLGLLYVLLAGCIIWLTSRKVGRRERWAVPLWISAISGVLIYVLAFAVFEMIASSFRFRPDVDLQSSAITALLILWVSVIFLSYILGRYISRSMSVRNVYIGPITSAIVFLFMAVTSPVADFFNACVIGVTFFLDMSC